MTLTAALRLFFTTTFPFSIVTATALSPLSEEMEVAVAANCMLARSANANEVVLPWLVKCACPPEKVIFNPLAAKLCSLPVAVRSVRKSYCWAWAVRNRPEANNMPINNRFISVGI